MDKTIKELLSGYSEVEAGRLAMMDSLLESIAECGGDSFKYKLDILDGMTVLDLIDSLGQNNIRFYYDN